MPPVAGEFSKSSFLPSWGFLSGVQPWLGEPPYPMPILCHSLSSLGKKEALKGFHYIFCKAHPLEHQVCLPSERSWLSRHCYTVGRPFLSQIALHCTSCPCVSECPSVLLLSCTMDRAFPLSWEHPWCFPAIQIKTKEEIQLRSVIISHPFHPRHLANGCGITI